jgi:CrcB protein
MKAFLLVAIGGALGALARYGTGVLVVRFWREPFPLATWIVNLAGCFLIGMLASVLERRVAWDNLHYLLIIGFLGAYTTFSTFSMETVALLQRGQAGLALVNAGGSVVLGILMVWAGLMVGGAIRCVDLQTELK